MLQFQAKIEQKNSFTAMTLEKDKQKVENEIAEFDKAITSLDQ